MQTFYNGDGTIHSELIKYTNCIDGTTRRRLQEYLVTITVIESENKNFNSEDCIELLSSVGIVPRRLSLPNTSEKTFEQISAAIAETCFGENAVMDMIDPSAFEACYASGTEPVFCIIDQIINYLNGLDYPTNNIPGTPLTINVTFDDLTHDELAPFLHAAVAANGNEHVLAGIYYARRNLNHPIVSNNLVDIIVFLSKLSFSSPASDLDANVNKLISILNRCETFPESQDQVYLINNLSKLEMVYQLSEMFPLSSMDYFIGIASKISSFQDILDEANRLQNLIDNGFEEQHEELIESDVSIIFVNRLPRNQFVNYPQLAAMTRVLGRTPTEQVPNNISHPIVGSMAHLPEDLRWGADGKIDGIHNVDAEVDDLEEYLEDLMDIMAVRASSEIKNVKNFYFNRFVLGTLPQDDFEDHLRPEIGDYEFDDLTEMVMRTPEVSNAISKFVEDNLENELKRYHGDINELMQNGTMIFPERIRPRFSSYLTTGLAIIMNDIETMDVRIIPEQSQVNVTTGEYLLVLAIQIVDNFGLDYNDAITYQSIDHLNELNIDFSSLPNAIATLYADREDVFRAVYGDGFSSWYVLQHKRNYKPFRTNLTFQMGVTGNYRLD